jgi:thymidine kinase
MNNNNNLTTGFLEIILGPMKSGKTTKLIEIYKQYNYCNIKVCVINHIYDTRYSNNEVVSHDNLKIPCIMVDTIEQAYNDNNSFQEFQVILINEAQFFQDLYTYVLKMLNNNKIIYISGLDGDYKKSKIGQIIDLIPHANNVTKIHSLCGICKNGNKAIFSKRITNQTEQVVIGVDNYIPVCRKCYDL